VGGVVSGVGLTTGVVVGGGVAGGVVVAVSVGGCVGVPVPSDAGGCGVGVTLDETSGVVEDCAPGAVATCCVSDSSVPRRDWTSMLMPTIAPPPTIITKVTSPIFFQGNLAFGGMKNLDGITVTCSSWIKEDPPTTGFAGTAGEDGGAATAAAGAAAEGVGVVVGAGLGLAPTVGKLGGTTSNIESER